MSIPLQVLEKHASVKQKDDKIKTDKVIYSEQCAINLGVSLPLSITEDLCKANEKEQPTKKKDILSCMSKYSI